MEITNRKENPILNRVEIAWEWRHVGAATPTRNESAIDFPVWGFSQNSLP